MKRLMLIVGIIMLPGFLYGAVGTADNGANLLVTFQSASQVWRDAIVPHAKYVFGALVTIDFVLEFGLIAVGGKVDFSDFIPLLIRKTLIIGFFLMLFQFSGWLATIPKSFSIIGDEAGGVAVDVDSVLDAALNIVGSIWHGISLFHPGDSLALVISGIILLIAFGLMAAQLFLTLVKTYALLAVAPLVFSLAGLSQTRQMAYNPFFAIIKAGMELLFIKLFMGLTITKMHDFAANVDNDDGSIMVMILISILMVSVVQMIPSMVESLMSGTLGSNSTAGIGTLQSVAASATGAAGGAVGMGAAVKAASSLAKEQRSGGDSSASTFKNLRSAFADDVKRSFAGENIGGGSIGGRMAFKHSSAIGLSGQSQTRSKFDSVQKNNFQRDNEEQAFAASQKE